MNTVKRSIVTVREMIRDRGWDGSDLESISIDEIVNKSSSSPVMAVEVPSCDLRIVWNMMSKFRTADMKKILVDPPSRVILIVSDAHTTISPATLVDSTTLVEIFRIDELQVNISRHSKVPLHEAIREESEIQEIMRAYSIKSRYQLPIIKTSDPMARYLALRPGQLVRITRSSPSAGSYVLFRCCTV